MPFKQGNPGGPGRPKKTAEEKYSKVVYSAIKPDDLKEVIEAIMKAAKRGDMRAAKLVLEYTVGTPVQKTEISGKDGGLIEFGVTPVDYRIAIAALAPRSVDNSIPSSESESTLDGETLG